MKEDDKIESRVTAFTPFPGSTYRFVVSTKAAKLNIRLEDHNSKKQWSTGDLEETTFLTSTNKIPNATPTDYVSVFHGALDYLMGVAIATDTDDDSDKSCSDDDDEGQDYEEEEQEEEEDEEEDEDEDDDDDEDEKEAIVGLENDDKDEDEKGVSRGEPKVEDSSGDDFVELNLNLDPAKIRRKLLFLENDALQLELSVNIRVLDSAWAAKYLFRLEPISLDRVDILEATLRDVEEVLAVTRKMLVEAKNLRVSHFTASTDSSAEFNDEGQTKWTSVEAGDFNKDDAYQLVVSLSVTLSEEA